MKFIIVSLLFILHFTFYIHPALAVSPTATPSASIKTKLQELQEQIASKAAKIKSEISQNLQNRVYVGFIKSKSETSLTLATTSGSMIINLNQDTVYSGKTKTTLKSLIFEDYIAALGDIDDTQVLTAKKVIKLIPPEEIKVETIWGMVLGISGNQITINNPEGKTLTIISDKKTITKYSNSNSSLLDIKINKPIIVVGSFNKTNSILSRFIYILPYSSSYQPKPASPSATIKPTVTVKPTGKVTPTPTKKAP